MQKYVTAKKIAIAGDFDLANFDMSNTIFTLFLASGYSFASTPPYCGWHTAINVNYNGVSTQMLVSFMIQGGAGLAISCNSFGQNMGVGQINTKSVTIGPTSPNSDVYLDSAMSAYIHEVYETATDPLFNGYSWYNNDDDHYTAVAPKFSAKGGNNENGDLCAWTFGMNTAQQYLTTNPSPFAVTNNVINANLVLNGVYYLVQQQYVYSPPNSQCALTTVSLPTLPTATVTSSLSFYNGYKVVPWSFQFSVFLAITVYCTNHSFISPTSDCFSPGCCFLYPSTVYHRTRIRTMWSSITTITTTNGKNHGSHLKPPSVHT